MTNLLKLLFLIITFFTFSCTEEIIESNPIYVDDFISNDCNVYKVIIEKTKKDINSYVLVVNVAGKCAELSQKDYFVSYQNFLNTNKQKIKKKSNGKILLKFSESMDADTIFFDKLKKATALALECEINRISIVDSLSVELILN